MDPRTFKACPISFNLGPSERNCGAVPRTSVDGRVLWGKMPTVFAAAPLNGANPGLATTMQPVAIIGVILAVSWVWCRRFPLPIRGSVLAVGIFLAIPYAFDYDLAILALPFAWLGWEAYAHESKFQEVLLFYAAAHHQNVSYST